MKVQLQKNKLLSQHTTLGIGGPAKYFLEIKQIPEMQEAIKLLKEEGIPYIVIGKGSNSLFDDRGFDGCVLLNKIDFIHPLEEGIYEVGAGYSFSLLGVKTARDGWAGLEFASGIPASVGGAVFMNAGANGAETCQTLKKVTFVNDQGNLQTFNKEELHFGYRESSFQKMKGAIVAATFQLTKQAEARQKQLQIIQYRQKTQPYKDKSAGCVFRNPPGHFAGALIEKAGLKGYKIGNAMVSEMHANFLINAGGASSEELKKLIAFVQMSVKKTSGVDLLTEIRIIPYQNEEK